jgi:hypothetical protein
MIVHYRDLHRPAGLNGEGPEQAAEGSLFIPGGDDDGKGGPGYGRPLSVSEEGDPPKEKESQRPEG